MQTVPDKIPSFIVLQPDERPGSRITQPADVMSVTVQHPDKSKPGETCQETSKPLVNTKVDHKTEQQLSEKATVPESNGTTPPTEDQIPFNAVHQPLEYVR